jgi:uncharacterized protein (TIGR02246 family)
MDLEGLEDWTRRYVEAWRDNDPEGIGALFSEDARYYTHPYRDPWQGRDAIVKGWTANPDPPGSWTAEYRALAVTGDTGVIRGHTEYMRGDGSVEKEYANIFVVEFEPRGLCTEFTEFFVKKPEK